MPSGLSPIWERAIGPSVDFSLIRSWGYFFDPPPPEPWGEQDKKDIIVLVMSRKTNLGDTKSWGFAVIIYVKLRCCVR